MLLLCIWKLCLTLWRERAFSLTGERSAGGPAQHGHSAVPFFQSQLKSFLPLHVRSAAPGYQNEWCVQTDLSSIQNHLQLTFLKLMLFIPGEARGITHRSVLISYKVLTLAANKQLSTAEALFSSLLEVSQSTLAQAML